MVQSDQNQIETPSAADTCLVRSAKQGDIAALEELVKRHTKRVFSIARHFTRSREDAEDVTQETFLKACCLLKDFRQKAQFSTWLTRIAVNTALTKVSSSKLVEIGAVQEPFWETAAISEELSQRMPNPEELCTRSQLRRLLQKALEELPHIHSTVFVLRDVYGFSTAETAAALKLSVPQVKSRLFRARLQLRDHLSKSFIPRWTKATYTRRDPVIPFRPSAPECNSFWLNDQLVKNLRSPFEDLLCGVKGVGHSRPASGQTSARHPYIRSQRH